MILSLSLCPPQSQQALMIITSAHSTPNGRPFFNPSSFNSSDIELVSDSDLPQSESDEGRIASPKDGLGFDHLSIWTAQNKRGTSGAVTTIPHCTASRTGHAPASDLTRCDNRGQCVVRHAVTCGDVESQSGSEFESACEFDSAQTFSTLSKISSVPSSIIVGFHVSMRSFGVSK